jgi:hypothetical protein
VAQRYCTNCGAELGEEFRFCHNCGRPVHETAAVSTPEADVSVPPPTGSAEAPKPRITLGTFVIGLLVVTAVLWIPTTPENGSSGGGSNGGGGSETEKKAAGGNAGEASGTSQTFTNENYAGLSSLQTAVGAIGQTYVPSARARSPSSRAC